jgi:hypothetical protein
MGVAQTGGGVGWSLVDPRFILFTPSLTLEEAPPLSVDTARGLLGLAETVKGTAVYSSSDFEG